MRRITVLVAALMAWTLLGDSILAASPEQSAYWRQDEIREAALREANALGQSIPSWPRMTLATPPVTIAIPTIDDANITADDRLDEAVWDKATRFRVGPVFDRWTDGPFEYTVRAMRVQGKLALAIESPRSLAHLGALRPSKEFLAVDNRPVGPSVSNATTRELLIDVPAKNNVALALPAELVRYENGALPSGNAALGLDRLAASEPNNQFRTSALWIEPYRVTLTTASEPIDSAKAPRIGLSSWKPQTPDQRKAYCREREARARRMLASLDEPLLFVKRHAYFAGHIYDDYYTWRPGGGIYVVENPSEAIFQPAADRKLRPLVSPETNETLGVGVYRDPAVSWDARDVLFAFRGAPDGVTSIYTIGADGRGLARLTASDKFNDITPDYLPDGRIVFNSTRPKALVPCFNSGVDTLHTMNADGSDIHSISANNVNEFDPVALPDGRILYGRWEYVDKTALYMQSLWTMKPDGSMEEAVFANNLPKPTAVLDARPIPGSHKLVASLTPHNGQAVGAIAAIDPRGGKNDLAGVSNFTPEYPIEMDQGLHTGPSDPWPLDETRVLMANNAIAGHAIIEMVNDRNERELVMCDPEISVFAPMPLAARDVPSTAAPHGDPKAKTGRFLLVDVYQGLEGVERGEAKRLRIVEETARTSGLPPGGRWWNQAFLVSWQGAYIIKNVLGTVPIHEDGSACFEVPSGRAIYFEVLDENNRELQRMRTFVNASPGATRSCIGCHEDKKSAPLDHGGLPIAARFDPAVPQDESWGSGYIDYPTMIQPILDEHCVTCHGGEQGIAKGIDFSGGWTWAFNISYETMIKHRMTGFLNCNNSSVHTSVLIRPKTIGSGGATLADTLLADDHGMSRAERDLLFAWMDTNSNYYGTWDYTPHATCDAIMGVKAPLTAIMRDSGCVECHQAGHIGNDWVNLETPERSRILRAPMAKSDGGLGVEFCRRRKARSGYPLVDQGVQPPDVNIPTIQPDWDPSGEVHATFASTDAPHYQAMLDVIRRARHEALLRPRIDMPGSIPTPGECRMQVDIPIPLDAPPLAADVRPDSLVELSWRRSSATIGLQYVLHRGPSERFTPTSQTQIGLSTAGRFVDLDAPIGKTAYYALVVSSGERTSRPVWTSLDVPEPPMPTTPREVTVSTTPGVTRIAWSTPDVIGLAYDVFRSEGDAAPVRLNADPLAAASFEDMTARPETTYRYTVRSVDRWGRASEPSNPVEIATPALLREPTFQTRFNDGPQAIVHGHGAPVAGRLQLGAKLVDGELVLGESGHVTFDRQEAFDIRQGVSVELWVRIDHESAMPVVAAAGAYNDRGWFVQRFGGGWRWHLASESIDGGRPVVGSWTHIVGTFDGRTGRLYQDGKLVAEKPCSPNLAPWPGPLVIGQYTSQGPEYQVHGAVQGLTIFARPLPPEEIAERFKAGR